MGFVPFLAPRNLFALLSARLVATADPRVCGCPVPVLRQRPQQGHVMSNGSEDVPANGTTVACILVYRRDHEAQQSIFGSLGLWRHDIETLHSERLCVLRGAHVWFILVGGSFGRYLPATGISL